MVGFNAVLTSEHFGAFLTFGVLHAALLIQYIKVRNDTRIQRLPSVYLHARRATAAI